jgi:colanic acid/amylovoran biosynthesis glycosyltransferase
VSRLREVGRPAPSPHTPAGTAEPEGPRLRRPVAVVVSRFPKVTETFILREIQALERQGQPVRLVPLLRQHDAVVHADAVPWIERALYTPFVDRAILRENLRALTEAPGRYLRLLGRVLVGTLGSANAFFGALGIFPKSVYVGRVLAREGVGHLHAHFATHPATAAYIASEISGIPWSFTAHAHDIFLRGSRAMLGEKLRRSAFVRVISDYNRRFLEERYPGAADGRIRVIHMGIDPEGYGPASPEPGRILCVASLRPYKGIPTLVEACAREPLRRREFELLVVGDGPQRGALEERIRVLGLSDRVRLLGARPQEEVTRLLPSAQVFVHPSTVTRAGWMDGIPVALMEAMATHLPVVSTWVSGIPELVGDGREGILVFPDDPGALAEALADLLDDPERAREMGRQGRRKVEAAFRLDRCAGSLAEELGRHTPPAPASVTRELAPGLHRVVEAAPGGTVEAPLALRRWHRGTDALVAELDAPAGAHAHGLVVKVHREVDRAARTARERARVEYEVLRRLEGDGAPRAVALLDRDATVVMERAAGVPLDALLRAGAGDGGDRAQVLAALEGAGRWLHRFQERTEGEGGLPPEEAVRALLRGAGTHLDASRRLLARGLADETRAALAATDAGGGKRTTGHHCDFWPGNVLVAGERVTVIDFEGYRPGLPHEDAAWFLVHLELALARPWRDEGFVREAAASFLRGTGLCDAEDRRLLELAVAGAALRLLSRAAGSRGVTARLGTWPRRRILAGILRRAVDGTFVGRSPEEVRR